MLVNDFAKFGRSKRSTVSAALVVITALAMYNWMVTPHAAYLSAAKGYESAINNIVKKNKIIDNKVKIERQKLLELNEQSTQLQNILFTHDQAREFFGSAPLMLLSRSNCAIGTYP